MLRQLVICALLGTATAWGAPLASDGLLDFSLVMPPAPEQQVLARPTVFWEVRADAATHCASMADHDGFGVWRQGCVYWRLTPPSCTIVTSSPTSHSLMGRLFLLCLQAGAPS